MKLIRFISYLVLVSLLGVACAPITPPPPPTLAPTPLPTLPLPPTATLLPLPTATSPPAAARLVVWESLPPAQADALAADVTAFEVAYPNYTVEVQHYDDTPTLARPLPAKRLISTWRWATPPWSVNCRPRVASKRWMRRSPLSFWKALSARR